MFCMHAPFTVIFVWASKSINVLFYCVDCSYASRESQFLLSFRFFIALYGVFLLIFTIVFHTVRENWRKLGTVASICCLELLEVIVCKFAYIMQFGIPMPFNKHSRRCYPGVSMLSICVGSLFECFCLFFFVLLLVSLLANMLACLLVIYLLDL